MRVLVAFDKFKDSLTAAQACEIAARAIRTEQPDWSVDLCPLTDGGEGFHDVLTTGIAARRVPVAVEDPRGGLRQTALSLVSTRSIPAAAWRLLRLGEAAADDRTVAVVEMAAASGLALLPPEARDPWQTSSYGTGQLLRAAAEAGAAGIVLGIGGSATHDLGLGALSALGLEFRASDGRSLRPPMPAAWSRLDRIEGTVFSALPPIRIACDVNNPLLGPRGAAAVYAPQKGLRAERAAELERQTARMARLLCAHCAQNPALADRPGTGAAGGISFGLICAAQAELLPGFDLVRAWLDLGRRIAEADVIVTGEGRFDQSSLEGKGPGAIAREALQQGKNVHLFAGQVAVAPQARLATHAITPAGMALEQALRAGPANLGTAVAQAFSQL